MHLLLPCCKDPEFSGHSLVGMRICHPLVVIQPTIPNFQDYYMWFVFHILLLHYHLLTDPLTLGRVSKQYLPNPWPSNSGCCFRLGSVSISLLSVSAKMLALPEICTKLILKLSISVDQLFTVLFSVIFLRNFLRGRWSLLKVISCPVR